MGRQPTTRLQVSGYRFLLRRMEHALVRGDVRMLDDPPRAQSLSLIAGCVLASIAVAGCAILAYLRPHGALGDDLIIADRDSGALYVRIGDTLHPVLNLASARLIAGSPSNPARVSPGAIASVKQGPLVGIPGAPAMIPAPLSAAESIWTVCDSTMHTAVEVGTVPTGRELAPLGPGRSVLVTPRTGNAATTYLLYDGWRAKVDLRNTAVVRALRLDDVRPRPVSAALLATVPEAPAITAPAIGRAGASNGSAVPGMPVGTVVRISRAGADEHHVILVDGVQRVGRLTADLIRFSVPQPSGEIRILPPEIVATAPVVSTLPVATYPDDVHLIDPAAVCAQWSANGDGNASNTAMWVGDSAAPPPGAAVRSLAQADGDGPNIDTFAIAAGRGEYVRTTGLTGDGGHPGPRFLVTESGVLFGIADDAAGERLGLSGPPVPAPWPLLALLPRGPGLSTDRASVIRDSIVSK